MNAKFIWKSEYETGLPIIDAQHQGLFELNNQMAEMSVNEARSCAMELYRYTREHFQWEEKFLERIDYPQIENHKYLHEKLINQLNGFSKGKLNTDTQIDEFREFFQEWLKLHIMGEDQQYAAYNQSKS